MPEQQLQHAAILLQQQKYMEAERVLSALFSEYPANARVIRMMSETKLAREKADEAMQLVNNAIGIDPGSSIGYYIRARVWIKNDNYREAEEDLQRAINIDPYDADYFALLALMKIDTKEYKNALNAADKALELDAENILALNARSSALLKLNRKQESFETIEDALGADPDNAYTHANYAWGLLERGDPQKALLHFREALRKDPGLELARTGMIEALKARYFIYRLFLQYSFWMGNLQAKYQWGVIIGFYLVNRILHSISRSQPSFAPFVIPINILYVIFAFSSWIITPLSNLFLRLNRYGRHLLEEDEIVSSNMVAIAAGVSITGTGLFLITRSTSTLSLIIFGISIMPLLSSMFSSVKKRKLLVIYTSLAAVIGACGVITAFIQNNLLNPVMIIYLVVVMASQWIINYILIRENNH